MCAHPCTYMHIYAYGCMHVNRWAYMWIYIHLYTSILIDVYRCVYVCICGHIAQPPSLPYPGKRDFFLRQIWSDPDKGWTTQNRTPKKKNLVGATLKWSNPWSKETFGIQPQNRREKRSPPYQLVNKYLGVPLPCACY